MNEAQIRQTLHNGINAHINALSDHIYCFENTEGSRVETILEMLNSMYLEIVHMTHNDPLNETELEKFGMSTEINSQQISTDYNTFCLLADNENQEFSHQDKEEIQKIMFLLFQEYHKNKEVKQLANMLKATRKLYNMISGTV